MKILISDFDGTFFQSRKYSQELRDTVAEWKKEGNVIAISTARCACRMHETAVAIDLDCDYYICDHSAIIFDKDWNVISCNTVPKDELMDLFDRLMEIGVEHISVADGLYEYALCPDNLPRERETVLQSAEEMRKTVVNPVSLHVRMADADVCRNLCDEINGDPKSKIYASYCGGKGVFFFKKGNDKAIGGHKLLRIVGGEKSDVYTIGDGADDACMISEFKGYGMIDSHPDVVAVARKIYDNVGQLMRDVMDGKE